MGQKSLPLLHKIDTSMIWENSLYNEKYKWLSYNLWFIFIYYYKQNLFYLYKENIQLSNLTVKNNLTPKFNCKYKRTKSTNIRFSYHIELYCLEYYNYLLLINIFFLTHLNFFKSSKKKKKKILTNIKNLFN